MESTTREADLIDVTFANIVVSAKPTVKIISEEVIFYFRAYFNMLLGVVISSMGMATNIVNITVYWKLGIRDSVNITFIALSMWDMNICLMSGLSASSYIIDLYFPIPDINFISIQYVYFGYTRGFMYVLSTLVTVYLSLERSICIMRPLKVKYIFTASRVLLVNVMIVMFGLACYCPAWATQGIQWVFNPRNNLTRLVLRLSYNRREIDLFVDTFNGMVIPLLAQLLITINAAFMIHGVKKSAKFRNRTVDVETPVTSNASNEPISTSSASYAHKKANLMTNKDLRLTKVVVLLTIIFFTCNLPVVIVAAVRWLFPEIDIGKPQQNLYALLYAIVYLCGVVNSSVNIFVYYNVGTRYRHECLRLIGTVRALMKKHAKHAEIALV